MRRLGGHFKTLVAVLAISGCATTPNPSIIPDAPQPFDFTVDCGPIQDAALCHLAVEVAASAKLNPPPIAAATIRRPRADDDCRTAFHPCGPESVIVTIQSGDTLQEVPLIPTTDGWIRLDLIR